MKKNQIQFRKCPEQRQFEDQLEAIINMLTEMTQNDRDKVFEYVINLYPGKFKIIKQV